MSAEVSSSSSPSSSFASQDSEDVVGLHVWLGPGSRSRSMSAFAELVYPLLNRPNVWLQSCDSGADEFMRRFELRYMGEDNQLHLTCTRERIVDRYLYIYDGRNSAVEDQARLMSLRCHIANGDLVCVLCCNAKPYECEELTNPVFQRANVTLVLARSHNNFFARSGDVEPSQLALESEESSEEEDEENEESELTDIEPDNRDFAECDADMCSLCVSESIRGEDASEGRKANK